MYYQITVDCVIKSSRMLSLRGFDCLFLDLCRSQQSDFVLFGQEVLCGHFPPCVVVRVQRSLVFAPWLAGCPWGWVFSVPSFGFFIFHGAAPLVWQAIWIYPLHSQIPGVWPALFCSPSAAAYVSSHSLQNALYFLLLLKPIA